jgi:Carboxypeptidase regulatory-like domain/TonB-dependent Receptor Plug Domain
MHFKFLRLIVGLILLIALTTAIGSWAQTSRGTVSGSVTDSTGAVIPNADIQLVQIATNVVRETKTNDVGLYRFDAVALGTYSMKVTAKGFSVADTTGIEVRANQTASQDFTLKIGTGGETVEVSGAASVVALQTEEQLRGANIDAKRIMQLPIAGQNSLNLMLTVPGIAPTRTGNGGGVGSVNGSRARANKFLIDGADNNDVSVAGQTITMTNNDAIQEVSIQTANYSAEFGRSGGAVVNQITKSGTNSLHGSVAWVYDGQTLNASTQAQRISYFGKLAAGTPNPVLKPKNHDAIPAFTAGGPVYIPHLYDGRNKTFWFVAGQWDHYTSNGSTYSFTVPTTAGVTTLQSYAASCPNVALYLKALGGMTASNQTGTLSLAVPATVYATAPTCNGDARTGVSIPYGTGSRVVPNSYKTYNMQFRLDHVISNRQNLSARVFRSNEMDQLYDAGISSAFDTSGVFGQWNTALTHTFAITSTLTNELRANFTQTTYWWAGQGDGSALSALPTFGYGTLSGFGMSANYPQGRIPNTYQLQDVVTKVVGRHQFRAGWEYFRQIARQFAPANLRGAVTYSTSGTGATLVQGFANFMDDYSGWGTTTRVSRSYGSAKYHPTYTGTSGFFQDNWKVTSNLSVNLGLRWDYFGQPANIFTYPSVNFDPAGFSSARIKGAKKNFGPTVGFAWNPKHGFLTGDGKLVLRGGFQLSYDTSFNNLLSNMATGAPNNPANANVFPPSTGRGLASNYAVLFPAMVPLPFATSVSTSSQFTPYEPTPYTERWSLGIQRELPAGLFVDLSYVGSGSHHLNQQQELNPFGVPVQNATTGVWSQGPRLISTIGGRMVRANTSNSNYNAMQLEVKKRYSRTPLGAVLFSSAYTWSKSLGVVDDVFATTAGSGVYMSANPLRSQYTGWRTSDYGPSDNDRRHVWATSVVWDLPSPKMRFISQILGGWTGSTVFSVRSGTPFSVWNGNDRDLDGTASMDRPDIGNINAPLNSAAQAVPTATCSTGWQTLYGNGCVTPNDVRFLYYPSGTYAPFVPGHQAQKNSIYSKGGFISADASIIKAFKVREGMALEYRAEIFNVANTMNYSFTPLNTNLQTMFNSKDKVTGMPSATFLDYSQSSAGNRSMRMQLKFMF